MDLATQRMEYKPKIPTVFKDVRKIELQEKALPQLDEQVQAFFPKTGSQKKLLFAVGSKRKFENVKIGVVFSGGQAPGGHNVIAALFDALKKFDENNTLIGFLDGPSGILEEKYTALDEKHIEKFRNQGGFDLIGSGRTKIETQEQLQQALKVVQQLGLSGLVIIGGDDSNTNAAILAEYFQQQNCKTRVIGIPKTIDGDLKTKEIAISFGFDTAAKVYSEMIGNIQKDALSAKKYYHFIRLMGRSASHIALECALQTHPNITLISEEVQLKKHTLKDLTNQIVDVIIQRAQQGKDYGVVLIPEGIIEFVPEVKALIKELNDLLATKSVNLNELKAHLTKESFHCFSQLPQSIQEQLLMDRDPHGNVQVSKIETEKLFIQMVSTELTKRQSYKGSFSAQGHFFGYEGRAALPSNFDCDLCYSLGTMAAILVAHNKTGYICALNNLQMGLEETVAQAIPIATMMRLERRKGKEKPVIAKALVALQQKPFQTFLKMREHLQMADDYKCPGPIQFFGDPTFTDRTTLTLQLEALH